MPQTEDQPAVLPIRARSALVAIASGVIAAVLTHHTLVSGWEDFIASGILVSWSVVAVCPASLPWLRGFRECRAPSIGAVLMTIGSLCGLIAVSLASEALSIGFMRVGTVSLLGAAVLFILGWFPLWRREMGESWRGGGQRDSNIA